MTVVFSHCMIALPMFWAVYADAPLHPIAAVMGFTPLHILWGGFEAVVIFFILSGFVLSIPYWDGKKIGAQEFIARRFLRLYPTYFVCMVIGFVAVTALDSRSTTGLSEWVGTFWNKPITVQSALDHVFMLGTEEHNGVNPVIWSLAVEMQVSIMFPLLIRYMRTARWLAVPIALGVSFVAWKLLRGEATNDPVLRSFLLSTYYVWIFVLGAELARQRHKLQAWASKLGRAEQWTFIALALLCINVRWQGGASAVNTLVIPIGGAVLLIACAYFRVTQTFLDSQAVQWAGRVSYSLYLIHFIVLFSLIHAMPPVPALLLAIPLSFLAGAAIHALVEKPSIKFSRFHRMAAPEEVITAPPDTSR